MSRTIIAVACLCLLACAMQAQSAAGRNRKLKTVGVAGPPGPPGPPGANGTDTTATAPGLVQVFGQAQVYCIDIEEVICDEFIIKCPESAPFPVTGAFIQASTQPNFIVQSSIIFPIEETVGGVQLTTNQLDFPSIVTAFIFCSDVEPTYDTLG